MTENITEDNNQNKEEPVTENIQVSTTNNQDVQNISNHIPAQPLIPGQANPAPSKSNQKTVGKTVLTIIFLLLLMPIGIVLMWEISGWSKATKLIITALLLGLIIYLWMFVWGLFFPGKPGFYAPVDQWNKFENSEFSFSYPKGTKIDKNIVISGVTEETRVVFKGFNSLVFDISKVDPKLYGNAATSTTLETYAQGVLSYNQARPKDFSFNSYSENGQALPKNSCLPDYAKDKKIKPITVGSNKAYSFELYCAYQGPEGEYQLLGNIESPGEFNQYWQPVVANLDGTHTYYYVEHNGSIYQIHFDYHTDDIYDTDPANFAAKILLTLKFK